MMSLENESFGIMQGIVNEEPVKPAPSTSLFDMFRLKRKSPKQIEVTSSKIFTESLDYANYLLEIHEDKLNAFEAVASTNGGLQLTNAASQIISFDDLREGKKISTQKQAETTNSSGGSQRVMMETNEKVMRGNGYKQTTELKQQIMVSADRRLIYFRASFFRKCQKRNLSILKDGKMITCRSLRYSRI